MMELALTGPYKVGDQILGDLEVTGFLGMGGHAYVYECVDRYMDATIAVKVIPNAPGRGKDLLKRARAEAKLLFKLNHPNVVRVITARPVGDQMVCIVMEKLEGLSLRQLLRLHKRFTVTEALLMVRQIAAGVGAAHRLDVIHRDIKPENVFVLPPENQVKVLDFGIAKFLGQGMETTNKLRVHGTPLYMSPEHLQSSNITHRSDIYELGGVAFELMTGKIPCLVDLENPNFQQMAYVQIMKPTPPVSRLVRDVGPRTVQLIKRATAKDPTQRYGSMQEVIDAIDEALAEQKSLFPNEAENIRYVNDAMIRAAKLGEQRTDEDNDDWKPVHEVALSPRVNNKVPPRIAAESARIDSIPQFNAAKAPLMAPTVEVNPNRRTPEEPPHASVSTVTLDPSLRLRLPTETRAGVVTRAAEAKPRSSSLSNLNLYATNDTFSGESTPRTSWLQVPLPVVVVTVLVGLAIAFAISWSDIQKITDRKAAAAQTLVAHPVASQAPVAAVKQVEVPAVQSVPPRALAEAPSASDTEAAKPTPSTGPVSTQAARPKASPPRPAPKDGDLVFSRDNDVPKVTKAELDRMRAREKAFAADLDRETAAAKKAKAANP